MPLRPAHRPRARLRTGALPLAAATVLVAGLTGALTAAGGASAAAAPAGRPGARPGVSAAHAASAGSTAVRLTWHNPNATGRVATVVRYAAGSHAPTSPTAGLAAGRPNPTRSALTVDRLHPATRYSFALFAAYGHGRYGARAVVHATTGPDSVRRVQPFGRGGTVTITWLTPRPETYAATVVRYTTGGRAPTNPHEGTAVALDGAHATSVRITGLPTAAAYAAAIWTRDRAGRYSSIATARFTTPAAAGTATGALSGTVTDDAAHPLAGVDVLVVDGDSGATWSTTTDGSGHYAITVPAGGVTVLLDGSNATGGDGDTAGYQADLQRVVVPAGAAKTVNGALDPGGEIDGQVTDRHGDPLAGVGISPRPPEAYVNEENAFFFFSFSDDGVPTTGVDGRFHLRGMPPVAEQICYDTTVAPVTGGDTDAAGYRSRCEHRTVAAGPGAPRTLDPAALLGAASGSVTGVVTDAAGHPVPGVIVDVSPHDPRIEAAGGATTTDGAGRYRISGLPRGRYDVCADPSAVQLPAGSVGNALTCRFAAATVTRAHVTVTNVTLRAAGALGGRVRVTGGAAIPAVVIVQSQGGPTAGLTVTDRHGQYVVPNLAPGRYRVCFEGLDDTGGGAQPGCYRDGDLVQVRRGVTRLGVDAQLPRGGAVSGRVTGVPDGATVFVATGLPNAEEPAGEALADDAGNYQISGLPAGRYAVCAVALLGSGENGACYRGLVTVRIGHVTSGINIAVHAGGTVTATVTNEDGRPVSGVDVAVVASCPDGACGTLPLFATKGSTAPIGSDMTDGDGRVTLSVPPASHYAVCAFAYYGAATSGDPATGYLDACTSYGTFGVTVRKGHDTAIAFTLHPAGAVAGRVTDTAGHPLAGVRLRVSGSSSTDYLDPTIADELGDFGIVLPGPANDVTTDADGTYVVPGVAAGKRTVCFDAGDAVDVTVSSTAAAHPNGILGQCFGGPPGSRHGGTAVTVTASATVTGIDQQLADAAVITGRIVDRSTGWPVRDSVAVVFSGGRQIKASGADAVGHYRIAGLPPGTVQVCFAAYRYRSQCYDGVAWNGRTVPAKATPVKTTAGGTVTLKYARLRRE